MEPGDCIDAAVRAQRDDRLDDARRFDQLWGPEPPYTEGPEDRASIFQHLYYGWIGDFIYKAAAGSITEKDLPAPTRSNRSYNAGKCLSQHAHRDVANARAWDAFIGGDVVYRGEHETCGVLLWVGLIPQSDRPRSLVAGVRWSIAPRHRRNAPAGSPSALHDGTVHGTRLFDSGAGTQPACSCEPIDSIELLPNRYGIPPPPRPVAANVLWSLVRAHKYHLLVQIPAKLISDLAAVFIPVLLEMFVTYLSADDPSWGWGLLVVLGVFLTSTTQSCASHKYDHMSIRAAAVFETSAMGLLFEKCLTVARKALILPEMSVGRIMNLAGNDVSNIGDLNWYVMYFWSAPLQLCICIALLYRLVGWCALSSFVVLAITFPIQGIISKWQQEIRERMASVIDSRIKRTNELLSGIRIVKFMGWEPRFLSLIEQARDSELMHLKKVQITYILFMFVDGATPILVISVLFVLYHLGGNELTPRVVFPTIALLNTMRIPFFMLPVIVSALLQCMVSTKRFTAFLECDDTHSEVRDVEQLYKSGVAAAFNDATVHTYLPEPLPKCRSHTTGSMDRLLMLMRKRQVPEAEWYMVPAAQSPTDAEKGDSGDGDDDEEDTAFHRLVPKDILRDVNAIFPEGQLTVVVGATGSGKSTLLGSLLGECDITSGELWAKKSIAFVPQQPWIMNATLRENILFFGEEDAPRLAEVIDVCQLQQDLKVLSNGLETEIGEKGINLSGGQKARVSLARALYADRDLYLLDDPLSALDAHVGAKIVADVIQGKLAGKTRVLATHQMHVLPQADHIIVLRHGRVAFSGDYAGYVAAQMDRAVREDDEDEEAKKLEGVHDAEAAAVSPDTAAATDECGEPGADAEADADGKLITTEEKAIGHVPLSTYLAYIRACGGSASWIVLGVVFVVTELANVANGVWLSIWSTDALSMDSTSYMLWYLFVVFLGMFSAPLRSYMCYQLMRIGSRNMHHTLLLSIGTGSMGFFDSTPMGRILNRFTKDVGSLDNSLNDSYMYLLHYLFSMISTIALMAVAQPLVIVAVIPCGFIYYKLMVVYSASNRETRRIKSIAHSPVFSLLEESVHGQRTIAVYEKQHVTMRDAFRRLDTVYSALYMQNIANRWLGTRLEFVSSLIIAMVALIGVVSKKLGTSTHGVGLVSLSLTMALTLTETLNWLVRQVATVEANMNCVERILHYINEIEHETMPEIPALVESMKGSSRATENGVVLEAVSPTGTAPQVVHAGSLEFRDVQMRYREGLPLVLRDVSFRIQPRQKVGIVGRTGSGKSTLLLTFMRMVDICGGDIIVNGRPIRSFGLRELRRQFSMIPQDPVLFDGTVRLNVDPFLEASSEEVWQALELVGLRERIASEPEGIDGRVLEGGSNFSVGQRQLLCMARALLKKGSGFILMDEATANIDQSLDRYIQTTVMSAFSEYTVITIAHRLQTVATYDMIIVMDHGVVAEMGSPSDLVNDCNSVFRGMVDAMGPSARDNFVLSMEPKSLNVTMTGKDG